MISVKICGLVDESGVRASRDADFLGFVVSAGTRRSLEPATAARLASLAGRPAVAVTTSKDVPFLIRVAREVRPYALQLNGAVDVEQLREVRAAVGCQVWVAVHISSAPPIVDPEMLALADRVVLDTATPQGGGSGELHDHGVSAKIRKDIGRPVTLAGGLTPENVAAAISAVRPDMVDVSSGVETDGVKDAVKIERFIREVRRCQ